MDDPVRWLGSSPVLDLDDPRLRLRARALTQLCRNEREKALAVYGFVKRIPFAKPFKLRLHTAREVIDAHRGDSVDKATVMVALSRLAGLPARIRWILLSTDMLQGMPVTGARQSVRPLVEVWTAGRWARTDTYIYDATYMAAARQRLREQGWERGYGIHVQGHTLWDGRGDAFLGACPIEVDPMVVADLGVFGDPLEFIRSDAYREQVPRFSRALYWNLLSPVLERSIRAVRDEPRVAAPPPSPPRRKA